MTPYTTNI